jgi:hypothetical protein
MYALIMISILSYDNILIMILILGIKEDNEVTQKTENGKIGKNFLRRIRAENTLVSDRT